MILDKLTLFNVGPFKGWHSLDLSPESKDKRVVLLGALNGSGKTTIHEAIQIALFGRQSAPAKRENRSYERYISSLVNRDSVAEQGAVVELMFRHTEAGEQKCFRVRRTWKRKANLVKEDLDVYVNGHLDRVLSETWHDRVQDIFPSRIASLFFFDGERIEELADFDRLPATLREAVVSLLGLDIVDKLVVDLGILKKRKAALVVQKEAETELKQLEDKLDSLEREREEVLQVRSELLRSLEIRTISIGEKMEKFKELGGEQFLQFDELQKRKAEIGLLIQNLRKQLRTITEGELPFALLRKGLFDRCQESIAQAVDHTKVQAEAKLLDERDRQFSVLIEQYVVNDVAKQGILDALQIDQKSRVHKVGALPNFDCTEHDQLQLETAAKMLEHSKTRSRDVLSELSTQLNQLDAVERKLSAVPSQDSIAKVKGELESLVADAERLEGALARNETDLGSNAYTRSQVRQHLSQQVENILREKSENSEAKRIADYADWSREALSEFGELVVRHHVSRIEAHALEAIKLLMRKDNFISDVSIDPETFSVRVFGAKRDEIDVALLSAGERQLLATSLLWALAKASGQSFPTVIDTPLGRLDSRHRARLVGSYFPYASEQIILLSTDEEINAAHYATLEPHMSHAYTLNFKSDQSTTVIEPGYSFAQELAGYDQDISA